VDGDGDVEELRGGRNRRSGCGGGFGVLNGSWIEVFVSFGGVVLGGLWFVVVALWAVGL